MTIRERMIEGLKALPKDVQAWALDESVIRDAAQQVYRLLDESEPAYSAIKAVTELEHIDLFDESLSTEAQTAILSIVSQHVVKTLYRGKHDKAFQTAKVLLHSMAAVSA